MKNITVYKKGDELKLKANQWADVAAASQIFDDREYEKYTMRHDGKVVCIVCFRHYWGDNYVSFILADEDFPVMCARTLREFMEHAIEKMGARRVQTDGVAHPDIDRFHEFLGFRKEGTRRKFINDNDYNMWGMVI